MKRFVLQQLIEWKNREDRKPLILNGARQVGKTWLLHEFAKLEYKKEAYVVCRKNNLARQLFSQDFNVDRILRGLRAMTSVDITPGDTLIILDEIQDIPEALESLKHRMQHLIFHSTVRIQKAELFFNKINDLNLDENDEINLGYIEMHKEISFP